MLAALIVMAGTPVQQQDPVSRAWLATLSPFVESENAGLCVDIDELAGPKPFVYPRRDGYRGLERLAAATDRFRVLVDGIHVFRRRTGEGDLRASSPHEHVMDVLQALSITEMSRLTRGELSISNLPSVMQSKLFYAIASLGNGLGDAMVANYADRIGMRLILDPVANMDSRTNEGKVSFVLTGDKTDVPIPEVAPNEPPPLGRPNDGALNFGNGEILTLAEICARAERAFKSRIAFDPRLERTRYFISGSYTEQRLIKVLTSVTEPVEIKVVAEDIVKTDFTAERQAVVEFAFGLHSDERIGVADLTVNDVIRGRIITIKDLYGTAVPQRLRAMMSEYRLEPTDQMQIKGELYLAFAAPGLATLDGPDIDGLGNHVPYSVPYFIKVGF